LDRGVGGLCWLEGRRNVTVVVVWSSLGRSNWAACPPSLERGHGYRHEYAFYIQTTERGPWSLGSSSADNGRRYIQTTPSFRDCFKSLRANSCSLWRQARSVALSCPVQHVKSEVLRTRTTTNDKQGHVIGQTKPRHSSTTAIRDTDLRRLDRGLLVQGKQFRSL
jgi:hypothetical protein